MAISLVGVSTGTNTATPVAHSINDLIIMYGYRSGSTTAPTLPAGWTSKNTQAGTSCAHRLIFKTATATNDAGGTLTNAVATVCHVYHSSLYSTGGSISLGGVASVTNGASNTVNYPTLTFTNGGGTSWAAGFIGVSNTSMTIATAPAGMTNQSHETAAANQAAGHDTNGTVSSWSSTNVTTTGTAGDSVSCTVEIVENVPASLSITNIVQRTATAYDNVGLDNSVGNDFTVIVPNSSLASNGVLLAVCYPSGTPPISITDNQSNSWSTTALVTADAGGGNNALSIYYLSTANTNTQLLTLGFGASTAVNPVKAWVYETYNVVGAHNGAVSGINLNTAGVLSPGAFTPTNNNANGGNIIFAFMAPTSNSVTLAAGIMPANNYTLMDADISMPGNGMQFASAVYVQATAAATTPLFNLQNGGTSTYNVAAVALSIGSQGTAKPAGIHVDGTAFFGSSGPGTKWKLQLPHTGNLVCLAMVADAGSTSSLDSLGNTMSVQGSGLSGTFYYEPNLTANPGYFATLSYASGPANVMCVAYDISGADPSPFTVYASQANQTATTNFVSGAPNITPTTSNGLVIATEQLGTGPSWGSGVAGGVTSPSGAINAYAWYYCSQFTAGISTTTLTVSSTAWGANPLYNGTVQIVGSGVTNGTAVTAGTGTTYTIAPSQTVTAGTVMNQLDPDGNTLNWGNGCAHYYVPSNGANVQINWTWNVPWQQGGAAGAIAFKAAPVTLTWGFEEQVYSVIRRQFQPLSALMRQDDIFIPSSGPSIIALLAHSSIKEKARATPAGTTPIFLRSSIQEKSRALAHGSTSIASTSSIKEKSRASPTGRTSLRSRALNAVKSRLTFSGNVSLHSKSASQTKSRTTPFVGLLLRVKSAFQAKSYALAHGSSAITARGANKVQGRSLASGTTHLLARSSAKIKSKAIPFVGLLILARSSIKVKSHALRVGTTALLARGSNKAKSNILFAGTTHLASRSAAQVKARAVLHSGAIFQLLAHSAMMVKSHVAAYKGTAAMLARSSIKVKSNASRTGVTALLARGAIKVKGHALVASGNFIQLLARSASQVKSRVRPATGAAGLHSRGAARVAAQITFSGTTRLLARSSAKVKGRGNPFVGLLLRATSAIQAKGRALPKGTVHILARSAAQVKSSTQASGRVVLRARSAVQAKSHSTFIKLAVLYARSSATIKGRAFPQGGVIQLLARAAFKIFGRSFIGGKIVFNPKFVATAQNIYYIATAQPISWTSDDLYAIRDLTPSLAGTIEGETATFDFGPRIASTITISAITSVTCVVKTGYDAAPQSRLSGPPVIGNSPSTGIAGQAVAQNFVGGIGGCVYLVTCLVMCSDGIPRSIEVGISCYRPF